MAQSQGRDVLTIPSDATIIDAAEMIQKRIRHMPVVDEGEIVGLLSIRDVVRAHVMKLQSQAHFLSEFIR